MKPFFNFGWIIQAEADEISETVNTIMVTLILMIDKPLRCCVTTIYT